MSNGSPVEHASTSHTSRESAAPSEEAHLYNKSPIVPPRRRSSSKRLMDASDTGTLSQSQTKSKVKPPIPPRPDRDSFRRTTSDLSTSSVNSVDEILESVNHPLTPSRDLISPLKPANTSSLWKDTVSSLSPDLQEFFNSDTNSHSSYDPWNTVEVNYGASGSNTTWTANFDSDQGLFNKEAHETAVSELGNCSTNHNPFDQITNKTTNLRIGIHPANTSTASQSLLD